MVVSRTGRMVPRSAGELRHRRHPDNRRVAMCQAALAGPGLRPRVCCRGALAAPGAADRLLGELPDDVILRIDSMHSSQ
jgi:hypothetical protein